MSADQNSVLDKAQTKKWRPSRDFPSQYQEKLFLPRARMELQRVLAKFDINHPARIISRPKKEINEIERRLREYITIENEFNLLQARTQETLIFILNMTSALANSKNASDSEKWTKQWQDREKMFGDREYIGQHRHNGQSRFHDPKPLPLKATFKTTIRTTLRFASPVKVGAPTENKISTEQQKSKLDGKKSNTAIVSRVSFHSPRPIKTKIQTKLLVSNGQPNPSSQTIAISVTVAAIPNQRSPTKSKLTTEQQRNSPSKRKALQEIYAPNTPLNENRTQINRNNRTVISPSRSLPELSKASKPLSLAATGEVTRAKLDLSLARKPLTTVSHTELAKTNKENFDKKNLKDNIEKKSVKDNAEIHHNKQARTAVMQNLKSPLKSPSASTKFLVALRKDIEKDVEEILKLTSSPLPEVDPLRSPVCIKYKQVKQKNKEMTAAIEELNLEIEKKKTALEKLQAERDDLVTEVGTTLETSKKLDADRRLQAAKTREERIKNSSLMVRNAKLALDYDQLKLDRLRAQTENMGLQTKLLTLQRELESTKKLPSEINGKIFFDKNKSNMLTSPKKSMN